MKKHNCALLMLFVLALTLVSCSQKKETPVENPDKRPKQYVYEQLMAHNTPQAFERLMFMPVMGNGTLLYMFEKMYPECSGIYDSTGFYSDACDNGSWVENLIFSLEEARMGDEMLSLLEDEDSILPPIDFTEQENEIAAIETSVEKLLADSYGKLKVMEFANERFFLQPAEQGQILIHYSNNLAIRAFYDELFRLVKKEHWKMNTIEDSGITATELYEYEGEEKNPVKKIIQNDAAKVVSNYDQNGLVIKAQKYSIAGEEDKKTEQLINITEYEYDSKQRITVQTSTDMSYNTSGKLAKKTVKKQLFDYKKSDAASAKASKTEDDNVDDNEQELPPDYEYYEDGVLKRKTEYTTKDEYTTLIVFDKDNSVKAYYKDYVKIKDIYITDGAEKRVKIYE